MEKASGLLIGEGTRATYLVARSLLYADDTLLLEGDEEVVKTYMDAIAEVGLEYGLSFNWSKLELLRVRHDGHVRLPDGGAVREKETMGYLGGLLAADGRMSSELSRRLGGAAADFAQLTALWKHANVSRTFKIQVYKAWVVQKLMYCLHTGCFTRAEQRKLDGFHCRCLRQILGIPHAQYSRVSNAEVLAAAGDKPLSSTLLARQLHLFGDIARKAVGDPMRAAVFADGSVSLRTTPGVKRRGRPRQAWANYVHGHAVAAAGGEALLEERMRDRARWASTVWRYLQSG